jgi:hypothetical protein
VGSRRFTFSLLVHSDSSSPMIEFSQNSSILQVRSDAAPKQLVEFLCSDSGVQANQVGRVGKGLGGGDKGLAGQSVQRQRRAGQPGGRGGRGWVEGTRGWQGIRCSGSGVQAKQARRGGWVEGGREGQEGRGAGNWKEGCLLWVRAQTDRVEQQEGRILHWWRAGRGCLQSRSPRRGVVVAPHASKPHVHDAPH